MKLVTLFFQQEQVDDKKAEFITPVIEFHSGSNIMEFFADHFLNSAQIVEKSQRPNIKAPVP